MEQFLSATNNEELVEIAARIEMILIHVWFSKWDLKQFPSILAVNCNSDTLYEISKFYKNIKISGKITRDKTKVFYTKN